MSDTLLSSCCCTMLRDLSVPIAALQQPEVSTKSLRGSVGLWCQGL